MSYIPLLYGGSRLVMALELIGDGIRTAKLRRGRHFPRRAPAPQF